MIDHLGLSVSDFEKSMQFYKTVLETLRFTLVHHVTAEQSGSVSYAGYGPAPRAQFWIGPGKPANPPLHIAFEAKDRASVRSFYEVAMKAGGRDNGPPGLRPQYHANYYGAFILDLDGNNIEAVCHRPE